MSVTTVTEHLKLLLCHKEMSQCHNSLFNDFIAIVTFIYAVTICNI